MLNQKPSPVMRSRPRYGLVLVVLVVLTAIEVAASYLGGGIKVPVLLALAAAKAALVILYFMYIKYDSRLYAILFLFGAIIIIPLLLVFFLVMPKL